MMKKAYNGQTWKLTFKSTEGMDTTLAKNELQASLSIPPQVFPIEKVCVVTFINRYSKKSITTLLQDWQVMEYVDHAELSKRITASSPQLAPIAPQPQLAVSQPQAEITPRQHILVEYKRCEYGNLMALASKAYGFECADVYEWDNKASMQTWRQQPCVYVNLSYYGARALRERIGQAFACKTGPIRYNTTTIPAGAIKLVIFTLPCLDEDLPQKTREQQVEIDRELGQWLQYDRQVTAAGLQQEMQKAAQRAAQEAVWAALATSFKDKVCAGCAEHFRELSSADVARATAMIEKWAKTKVEKLRAEDLSEKKQKVWIANNIDIDRIVGLCKQKFPISKFNLTQFVLQKYEDDSDDDDDDDDSYAGKRRCLREEDSSSDGDESGSN